MTTRTVVKVGALTILLYSAGCYAAFLIAGTAAVLS